MNARLRTCWRLALLACLSLAWGCSSGNISGNPDANQDAFEEDGAVDGAGGDDGGGLDAYDAGGDDGSAGDDGPDGGDPGTDVDPDRLTDLALSDQVVTSNAYRLGINLGGDNYWGSVLTKNRIKGGGFEGVLFRHIARGPGGDATSLYDWNDYTYTPSAGDDELSDRTWLDVAVGADAWVLAGDRAWRADTIVSVEHAVMPGREEDGERLRFVFQDSGPAVGASNGGQLDEVGMLIEKREEDLGYVGQHGGPLWAFASGGARITTAGDDLPPGTHGQMAAVILAPGAEDAELVFPLVPQSQVDPNGTWRVSFWAKGDGELSMSYGGWGQNINPSPVSLTGEWQYFDQLPLVVSNYTDDSISLHLSFTNGTVKLDEVAAFKEGDQNPTAFRDELVALFDRLHPGSLRFLNMGGSDVDNLLKPAHERLATSFQRDVPPEQRDWPPHPQTNGTASMLPYSLPEFLELCEQVSAQPWYCVSGTVFPDEMENLMEYLAGPVESTYGAMRAADGHPQPWTEVFERIHLEMGNEAWNWSPAYAYGGWNGPEYWSLLFQRSKAKLAGYAGASEKVMFHIGAQNYNTWLGTRLVQDHGPAADGYAIAPYVIHEMSASMNNWNDEQLFSWLFSWVWHLNTGGPMQANADMIAGSASPDLEISIYEVNHHITGGDASNEIRNRAVASLGGALNVLNHMLLMLERYDVRTQNFFSLFQESYNGVFLWGSVLSIKPGQERYRPTFLALMLANKVLGGDLVRVDKSGDDPDWHASLDYDGQTHEMDVPYLHVYATRSGTQRGIILLNLHRTDALPIRLQLTGPAQGAQATRWRLLGDSIAADNEYGHEPQVQVVEDQVAGFGDGTVLELEPHSLTVLRWSQ